MNSPRKDLTDYFDAFRETERMSEQAAWDILDRATDPDPVVPPIPIETRENDRRKRGMIYLMLGLVALVGSALLIDMSVEENVSGTRPVSRPSAGIAEEIKVQEPAADRQVPTEQKAVSRYMETYRGRGMGNARRPDHTTPSVPLTSTRALSDSVTKYTIIALPDTSTAPPTPIIQGPIQMSGVRLLDLTREELTAFGIVPDDRGAGMFVRNRTSGTSFSWLGGYRNWHFTADSTPPAAWPAPILGERPILVSGRAGNAYSWNVDERKAAPEEYQLMRQGKRMDSAVFERFMKLQTEYLSNLAPTLIPIVIHAGSVQNEGDTEGFILWFQPTPDIIANLPATIRDRITEEVQAADDVARGLATYEQVLRSGLNPTLDLIRSANGSMTKSVLARNNGAYEIRLSLSEPREIRVELFDIEGRRLDQLVPVRELPFGDHIINLQIAQREPGMYLIVVSSDKQERTVHRVFLYRH